MSAPSNTPLPPLPAVSTPHPAPQPPAASTKGVYQITRPAGLCAISQKPILPGHPFHALLKESGGLFVRLDVLPEYWADADKSGLLASWQTVMPASNAPKKVFVDDAILLQLLINLEGTEDPAKLRFRFVLTLLLMRKRLVKHDRTHQTPAGAVWSVRPRGSQPDAAPLEVLDPKLNETDLADLGLQLQEILASDGGIGGGT